MFKFTSLKSKLIIPLVSLLFVLVLVIVAVVSIATANLVDDFSEERISAARTSVVAYLNAMEQHTLMAAIAIGSSGNMINHLNSGDREVILQYLIGEKALLGVDAITVTDSHGIAVARSNLPQTFGDYVGNVSSVVAGLAGERITLYTPTAAVPLVMAGTSPIMDGGNIIGSVTAFFNIGANEYLDYLADTFDVDFTAFYGDTSVSTTLVHPETGQRLVGTPAAPHISEAVLGRGEHVTLRLDVLGLIPYYAYYFPLHGVGDEIVGMFFVGIALEYIYAASDALQNNIIIIGIVGLVVAIGMSLFIVIKSLKPLSKLSVAAKEVTSGNIHINMDRANLPKDEIGTVILDVYELVDIIKHLIDDLNKLSHEFTEVGDIEYRIDTSKYNNAFKELVEGANGIIDCQVDDILPVIEAVNKLANGDFSITVNDLPGKKIILPQSIRAVTAKLNELYDVTAGLVRNAAQGDFESRIDTSHFEGSWAALANGLNDLMSSIAQPLADVRHNIEIMSKGDFSHLEGDYPGTFGALKDACNLVNDITEIYIKEISQTLQLIAKGDLTVNLKQNYVGSYAPVETAINTILDNLNSTLSDIQTAVVQVTEGSGQISSMAMDLAQGAMRQNSAIENLSQSIALIHEKAMQASNDASTANKSSLRIRDHVVDGGEAVKSMESAMNRVKESSESISKIIDVIRDVAFQTNLLALNASVEAARAGEHGKGFAVVADEVRTLASKSQHSTSETAKIVEEDSEHVNEGLKATVSVVESFDRIANNVEEISKLISEIAEISGEQLESISNVNANVSEITDVVTNVSATAQQSASAAQQLNSQAEILREQIAFFVVKKMK
ncbi:MAG: methyl-accepting chemotaxis protein [Defluviitaleaceae bacterium]|nr:methyl-accepting chemotaxis protein [Defluviitaleaceae bacterium]